MGTRIFRLASLIALLVGAQLLLVGCQKRCQALPQAAFSNLSQTEWRVVQSSNPGFKSLDNYTFITFKFNPDFSGEVYNVEQNRKTPAPDKVFKWKADPNSKALTVAYTAPPPEDTGDGQTATTSATDATLINYRYALSKELNLRETKTGYTYRLVPFSEEYGGGIIQPDTACTF